MCTATFSIRASMYMCFVFFEDSLFCIVVHASSMKVVKIKEEAEEAIRDIHSEMHKMRVKTGLVWSMEQKLAFDKSSLDAETDRLQRRNIIDEVRSV